MYIGCENDAGTADVEFLSNKDLGVLSSGVSGDGSVRWSSVTCDPCVEQLMPVLHSTVKQSKPVLHSTAKIIDFVSRTAGYALV